jgi:hydroxymethylbilane synthase
LAAQAHCDRGDILNMLYAIQDLPTAAAAEAEQLFSATVGGGCKTPIGCYARVDGGTLFMDAFLQSGAAATLRRRSVSGALVSARDIAEGVGRALLQ